MHAFPLILLTGLALLGHGSCWLAISNRLEALGWKRSVEKSIAMTLHVAMFAVIFTVGCKLFIAFVADTPIFAPINVDWRLRAYLYFFSAVAVGPGLLWTAARLMARPPSLLRSNHTVVHDLGRELGSAASGGLASRLTLALPGNECLRVAVHEKTLVLPRLDPALSGLVIAHLSDLHMSGRISQAWFERSIDLVNGMNADLVAVTGDIVETAGCLALIPPTLGRLKARHGVYFVLGNHDTRVNAAELRRQLAAAGLIDLGGKTTRLDVNGKSIFLAGNERPWIQPLPSDEELAVEPQRDSFRVLLAHTPDQLAWARRQQFDLMLAGHTHGGQIRLPGIGAIVSPSLHGGKYASGVFDEPPTVMHVSRGLSGLHLLRWNCPPELTRLVLVRG